MNRLLFLLFLVPAMAFSQLSDGDTAPNFTLTDTDGNSHTLYSYLNDGYSVILDFSATWCSPCWSYHNNGPLEDLWDDYGPGGEDMLMVFMIEADPTSAQACIYGSTNCSRGSWGDWTNKDYPVLNPPSSQATSINNAYEIPYWPTLYGIAPNKEVYELGRTSYNTWENWVINSFQLHNSEFEISEVMCGDDGEIDLIPFPDDNNLSYDWSNGDNTQDISGLDIDDYEVTITNNTTGYEVVIEDIEVDGYDPLEIDLEDVRDVSCPGGNDGTLEIDIDGGSGDYDVLWDNGDSDLVLDDLEARRYYVTLTDNETDCELYDNFRVEEPRNIDINFEIYIALCNEETGLIEFLVEGGTPPYSYEIDGEEYDEDEIELEPGDYEVIVIDRNDCSAVDNFTIDEQVTPEVYVDYDGDITCNNPSTVIDGAGSETGSNISYQWENENGYIVGNSIEATVTSGGRYTLYVTDEDTGCSAHASVNVNSNTTLPNATANASNDIDCNNSSTSLSSSGSSSGNNYSYNWTTTDGVISSATNGAVATATSAGTYTLEVRNILSGCVNTTTVTVSNTNPTISLNGDTQFCYGNSTELCLSPSASQTMEWIVNGLVVSSNNCLNFDSTETVTISLLESTNGCHTSQVVEVREIDLPTTSTSGDTGFCSGNEASMCLTFEDGHTYYWTFNDVILPNDQCVDIREQGELKLYTTDTLYGCSSVETFAIQQYSTPTATIATPAQIDCSNNTTLLDLTTESGSTVNWYDENGNLISSNEDTQVGQAGNYYAIVTSPQGCQNEARVTVIADTALPVISIDQPGQIDCNNLTQTINLNLSSSSDGVAWYDSDGNLLSNDEDLIATNGGEYTVVVTNSAGCSAQATTTVEEGDDIFPEASFGIESEEFSFQFTDESTGDGVANWNFGDGNSSSELNPEHIYSEPGIYTVCLEVTNVCGLDTHCEEVVAAAELILSYTQSNVSCHGAEDGSIIIFTDGGIAPLTILWDGTELNQSSISDLGPGNYELGLMDQAGTTTTSTVEIFEPEALIIDSEVTPTSSSTMEGSITIEISGGTGVYTVVWEDGSSSLTRDNLGQGDYLVLITDENDCSVEETITVSGTVSISEIEGLKEFTISPNPSTNYIDVNVVLDKDQLLQVNLISSIGERINLGQLAGRTINHRYDTHHLSEGIYLLELRSGERASIKKLIIVR